MNRVVAYAVALLLSGFFGVMDYAAWMAPNPDGWPVDVIGAFLTVVIVLGCVSLFWVAGTFTDD